MEKSKKLIELESELKVYRTLLYNYALNDTLTSEFIEHFKLEDIDEVVPFVLDLEHGYELSRYGHRNDKIRAYNGMGFYKGYKCSVGASHRA